jgi:ankyrin repeat protein
LLSWSVSCSVDLITGIAQLCEMAYSSNVLIFHLPQASLLLLLGKLGADFTLTDGGGRTPAHHAAAAGHLDCLRVLAGSLGAPLDVKDSGGRRPLDIAKGDSTRCGTR